MNTPILISILDLAQGYSQLLYKDLCFAEFKWIDGVKQRIRIANITSNYLVENDLRTPAEVLLIFITQKIVAEICSSENQSMEERKIWTEVFEMSALQYPKMINITGNVDEMGNVHISLKSRN